MARILFIIPHDLDDDRYLLKRSKGEGIYIPLGIAQLAAILEQEHQVRVLDYRLENKGALKQTLVEFKPDYVGFNISFLSAREVFSMTKYVRNNCLAKIILGGQYVSVFNKNILREHPEIDVLILGEGDYTIREILSSKFSKIKGIIYRESSKIVQTGVRPPIDLDKLPIPAIHLFKHKEYRPMAKHYQKLPLLPILTSRGCFWGQCTFCFHQGAFRRHSPEYTVGLVREYVNKYDVREIRFWDDTFIDNTDWVYRFCDLLDQEKLNVVFGCHARVNLVTKKALHRISKSGCWQIMYGIESGSQHLLDGIKKGITLKQARDAVRWAKETGLSVRTSFMLGLPGESPRLADKTIAFAKELDADITQFGFTTPYPGTEMYEALKGSLNLQNNLNNYCEYKVVYVPNGYDDWKELDNKLRQAYRELYLRPKYLFRNIRNLNTLEDIKKNYSGVKVLMGMLKR